MKLPEPHLNFLYSFFFDNVILQERSNYMEYQKVIREIDHLKKLCIAYDFLRAEVSLILAESSHYRI